MNTPGCPTCGKPNVSHGREYEQADNWARAYPRGLHTPAACSAWLTARAARLAETTAVTYENDLYNGGAAVMAHYRTVVGEDAIRAVMVRRYAA